MRNLYRRFLMLLRAPLLHFLVLGALIFVAAGFYANWRAEHRPTIVVDDGLVHYLENLYRVQYGIDPDRDTLERLIDSHIHDEILYREAVRLGLAEQDEIIRRRLVQKMEFLMLDSGAEQQPDEQVLDDYYHGHAVDYSQPATVSFRHLYFNGDAGTDGQQRAARALAAIRAGPSSTPAAADALPLQNDYQGLEQRAARQLFGDSEFIQRLFDAPVGEWSGPYRSGYGWHLLFVQARTVESLPPLMQVRDRVIADWQEDQRQQRLAATMQTLRGKYTVQRTTGGMAP